MACSPPASPRTFVEAYFLTSVVFTPQVLQSQLTGPGHWDGLRCPPLHPWDIRSQSRATSSADRDTVSDLTPPVDKNGLPGLGESTVKPGLPGCSLTHQAFIEKPHKHSLRNPRMASCLGNGDLGPSMPSPWKIYVSPEYSSDQRVLPSPQNKKENPL